MFSDSAVKFVALLTRDVTLLESARLTAMSYSPTVLYLLCPLSGVPEARISKLFLTVAVAVFSGGFLTIIQKQILS